jgi:hypothetical protein
MRLLEGANLFSLLSLLLSAGLFVLGNYQEFLDSSQLLLLRVLSTSSMLCIASGVCYVVTLVIWMFRRGHFMVFRLLYGMVASVAGIVAAFIAGVLETIARPL